MTTHAQPSVRRVPERRRHRVFVTRNSEYLCRDNVCLAVRDRTTGEFEFDHPAVGRRMAGGIRFSEGGAIASFSTGTQEPSKGMSLVFSDDSLENDVRTSALLDIARPPRAVVEHVAQYGQIAAARALRSRSRGPTRRAVPSANL